MKTNITIILSLAISLNLAAQNKVLKGLIQCGDEPVDFAYILNKSRNTGAESNNGGRVQIPALPSDTLIFKCLGYKDTTFIVSDEMLESPNAVLGVQKQEYALDEVKVVWFYDYASFKQAFLNLKLPPKYKMNLPAIDKRDLATASYFGQSNPGVGVSFSLGGKYLTKEQREENNIREHEARYARYNNLTSHENVGAFTGLQGDSLNAFIIYLRSHYKINPELSDYEIMYSVKLAYQDFLAMNTIDSLNFK